ncbi:unnamed protein product, partial [Symbiodinium sp. CCMP2456]
MPVNQNVAILQQMPVNQNIAILQQVPVGSQMSSNFFPTEPLNSYNSGDTSCWNFAGITTKATWSPAPEYQHTQYAEEVLPITCSRLPQQAAEILQMQFETLRSRMQRDLLRNDARWILSTGSQYGPTRQHILQVLCRLVYKWLLATFEDPPLAKALARIFYDLGASLWYHQTLHYLLPILADEDVAPLQQWHADYCDQQRLQHRILHGSQGEQADDTTEAAEGTAAAPRAVCEDFSPDAGS